MLKQPMSNTTNHTCEHGNLFPFTWNNIFFFCGRDQLKKYTKFRCLPGITLGLEPDDITATWQNLQLPESRKMVLVQTV